MQKKKRQIERRERGYNYSVLLERATAWRCRAEEEVEKGRVRKRERERGTDRARRKKERWREGGWHGGVMGVNCSKSLFVCECWCWRGRYRDGVTGAITQGEK